MNGENYKSEERGNPDNYQDCLSLIHGPSKNNQAGEQHGNPANKENPAKPFWLWRRKTLIGLQLLFNLGILATTSLQFYYARRQWEEMGVQSKAMQDQLTAFERSMGQTDALISQGAIEAQANRDAANAAKESNRITLQAMGESAAQSKAALDATIRASELDRRAWVGITEIRITQRPQADQPIQIGLRLNNSGNTPANDVEIHHDFSVAEPTEATIDPHTRPSAKFSISPGGLCKSWEDTPDSGRHTRSIAKTECQAPLDWYDSLPRYSGHTQIHKFLWDLRVQRIFPTIPGILPIF